MVDLLPEPAVKSRAASFSMVGNQDKNSAPQKSDRNRLYAVASTVKLPAEAFNNSDVFLARVSEIGAVWKQFHHASC
jgi:hypothetical protein